MDKEERQTRQEVNLRDIRVQIVKSLLVILGSLGLTYPLGQCFSKCCAQTSTITNTGKLIRNANC